MCPEIFLAILYHYAIHMEVYTGVYFKIVSPLEKSLRHGVSNIILFYPICLLYWRCAEVYINIILKLMNCDLIKKFQLASQWNFFELSNSFCVSQERTFIYRIINGITVRLWVGGFFPKHFFGWRRLSYHMITLQKCNY